MTASSARFFDSELISRLGRMELAAQRIVDGFLAGKNRSSRHGFSVEFVEHREYVPGDDLRHLDWKVLGRMDRYYIKRYEEETNITAVLLIDASASMTYSYKGLSKFEWGATAATALGHLLQRQRDAVGLALFDDELRSWNPPSAKPTSLAEIVARLQHTTPKGKSKFRPVLERLAGELPGRCLFVIISDFFLPIEEIESGLKLLSYDGHDVLVLQTLDEAERSFPFRNNTEFRDLEGNARVLAEPQRLKKPYLEALEKFLGGVRRATEHAGFDYSLLINGEPLGAALSALLATRSRRRRTSRRGRGA
jgi:uncharacterized protein (DUF58 family)